jgi:hypothetical protein
MSVLHHALTEYLRTRRALGTKLGWPGAGIMQRPQEQHVSRNECAMDNSGSMSECKRFHEWQHDRSQ